MYTNSLLKAILFGKCKKPVIENVAFFSPKNVKLRADCLSFVMLIKVAGVHDPFNKSLINSVHKCT